MIFNFISKKDILIFIAAIATLLYSITALNSHGYYHADEHYQIVEFAGLKLGTHTQEEIAWEFKSHIRPTLQPVICFGLLKTFIILNINNPYNQAFLLRLLSALFSIVVILFFIQNTKNLIQNKSIKTAYYFLSYFLWFIPVISVRFSSETWSGLMFLLALALFFNNSSNKERPFLTGFIFGISFLFRFQIAFAIIGFCSWLIFYKHIKFNYLLKVFTTFCSVLFIGLLLDSWFYGEFVFSPWKYFFSVVESGGNGFGISPWYFYIIKLLSYPSYFVGIPLILSIIIITIYKRDSFLLWCIVPFVLIHSLIPHKEERFIFPVIYLFPLVLIEGYTIFHNICQPRIVVKLLNFYLLTIFLFVNILGIFVMSQKSAGIGRMEITKYIHDKYGNENINLIFCSWANPYNPWHSLPVKFYIEKSISEYRINDLCEFNDTLIKKDAINLIVLRKIDRNNIDCSGIIERNNLIFEKQSIPKWIEIINEKYNGFKNHNILELYRYPDSK